MHKKIITGTYSIWLKWWKITPIILKHFSGPKLTHNSVCIIHRYLMTRLSLQVVYLWRHVSSTAPLFILWWSNLEIPVLFGPLHRSSPFIGDLCCQAIQTEHRPYLYSRENPKSSLCCEMSMALTHNLVCINPYPYLAYINIIAYVQLEDLRPGI
jgi:hypothetical protein